MIDVEKLHELLNTKEEGLFRLLFPQVVLETKEEDRFQLINVVLHAVDVLTWNFAAEFTEVNIFGNQGFNWKGDPHPSDDQMGQMCFGRASCRFSVARQQVHFGKQWGNLEYCITPLPSGKSETYTYGKTSMRIAFD